MFITRAYNSFEVSEKTGTVIKRSSEERLKNEIEHYESLPKSVSIWFPRMLSNGFDQNLQKHFLELEFYAYDNLGSHLTNPESTLDWKLIAGLLNNVLASFVEVEFDSDLQDHMKQMYENKTLREYEKLKTNFEPFKAACSHSSLCINDKLYLNFEKVWSALKDKGLDEWLYTQSNATFFHGDFCFSNILIGKNPNLQGTHALKCLDPRGKFGGLTACGDFYYDIAKLMHSTEGGYEYFINDEFEVDHSNDYSQITFNFHNVNKEKVHNIFNQKIYSNYNILRAKFIEGCIFIGMCARHYDSMSRQLAMYATGVKILNEVLEEM